MDYGQILEQIAGLEQTNRETKEELVQETIKHKTTTANLQKALNDLKTSMDREVQLNEKLAQAATTLADQKITNTQLQQDSKNFKLEMNLMKEHLAKEEERMTEEREQFKSTLEEIAAELRVRRDEYAAARKSLEKHTKQRADITMTDEDKVSSQEVESLRNQLEEGLTQVCELSAKLNETKQEHKKDLQTAQDQIKTLTAEIKTLQEDLSKSQEYSESLQNVANEYQEYVAELQKKLAAPCVGCGRVATEEENNQA